MGLSKRLTGIISLVEKGSRIADVGTDHGFVPITLVENGTALHAIAMDVRTGPLSRAREHVRSYGLEDRIELRLSDGMEKLSVGEADTVIISGMGGPLIIDILKRGARVAGSLSRLILSPQSEIPQVRIYLREHGFHIEKELFVKDEGKYYTILQAAPGEGGPADPLDDLFGRYLLDHQDPVLIEYLTREKEKREQMLPGLLASEKEETRKKGESMRKELDAMRQALERMEA